MQYDLNDLRISIDNIDTAIVSLLAERMRIVDKVGIFKKNNKIKPLDEKRWLQVLEDKKSKAKQAGLNEQLVVDIYNLIHEYALDRESNV